MSSNKDRFDASRCASGLVARQIGGVSACAIVKRRLDYADRSDGSGATGVPVTSASHNDATAFPLKVSERGY
ncbi:MAG: hypothetical protein AAF668_05185 [Pseudomonadota bacterium]